MKKASIPFLVLLLLLLMITACTSKSEMATEGKLQITVSILPEKFFVERIGGDRVMVNVMVGPGDDPHTYEPKPDQMAALSQSEIYFAIGVEFEKAWLDRFASANPHMKIVDLSAGIEKITLSNPSNEQDKGDTSGETHAEHALDPHIWTSPEISKIISTRIAQELSSLDEENAPFYQANLEMLLQEIEQLQKDIRLALESVDNRRFLVFHPAWGYFAREFGLQQIPIEVGGTEPSAGELAKIIDTAKKENIHVVFAQPEFSTTTADFIAQEINGRVVLVSALAENWLDNLRKVADSFKENL